MALALGGEALVSVTRIEELLLADEHVQSNEISFNPEQKIKNYDVLNPLKKQTTNSGKLQTCVIV